jgi:hypothetical protein
MSFSGCKANYLHLNCTQLLRQAHAACKRGIQTLITPGPSSLSSFGKRSCGPDSQPALAAVTPPNAAAVASPAENADFAKARLQYDDNMNQYIKQREEVNGLQYGTVELASRNAMQWTATYYRLTDQVMDAGKHTPSSKSQNARPKTWIISCCSAAKKCKQLHGPECVMLCCKSHLSVLSAVILVDDLTA